MKPRRALSLLTGVALLGVIASLVETAPQARASFLAAAGTARDTAQSLLRNAVTIHRDGPDMMLRAAAQTPPRATEGGENVAAPPPRIAVRTADAQPDTGPGNPLWALPLEQLSTTRERPIFSPSRRPPPSAPPHVAPAAVKPPVKPPPVPERPALSLVGTVIGADQIGVFLDTATKKAVRLHIGDDHHGWVLRQIETRKVTLVKEGEQTAVLELPTPGGTPAPSGRIAAPPVSGGLPGVATGVATGTVPILSSENSADEQPVRRARGARRQR